MSGFVPDTSCIIAAVCTWHEFHEVAAGELNRRLDARESMFLAAPALVEAYAVLTRLPSPHRLSPENAGALLDANFLKLGKTVALNVNSYRTVLRRAAQNGTVGGQTYDAVIAQCAIIAKATALLTFNARHFIALTMPGVSVVVPGAGSRSS